MTTILVVRQSGAGHARVTLPSPSSWSGSRALARMPQMIPEGDLFFWTPAWQELERQADQDLDQGRHRLFSDFSEAARWLLDAGQ